MQEFDTEYEGGFDRMVLETKRTRKKDAWLGAKMLL